MGMYLVCPASNALIAASLIVWGVSKSGSPAANESTSFPARCIALARFMNAMVTEGLRL